MDLHYIMMEDSQKSENQNDFSKPPEADMEIRTMASDFKTLKMSGGDLESIQLKEIPEEPEAESWAPGYIGPEKAIFSQTNAVGESSSRTSSFKIIILIIGVFAAAAVIGFLTYYLSSRFL